jgi:small subunit ribosomal protein S17
MTEVEGVEQRGSRRSRKGTVLRKSGDKTVVVKVEQRRRHPLYGKVVKHETKLHVHDENNRATPGDTVTVVETRPLSKMKRWRLLEIAGRAADNGTGAKESGSAPAEGM